MPYKEIIEAVRDLGFPIVTALALLWIVYKQLGEIARQLTDQTAQLKAQTVLSETQSSMLSDVLDTMKSQNSSLARAVNNTSTALDLVSQRMAEKKSE